MGVLGLGRGIFGELPRPEALCFGAFWRRGLASSEAFRVVYDLLLYALPYVLRLARLYRARRMEITSARAFCPAHEPE
jgi:hypothetical protein